MIITKKRKTEDGGEEIIKVTTTELVKAEKDDKHQRIIFSFVYLINFIAIARVLMIGGYPEYRSLISLFVLDTIAFFDMQRYSKEDTEEGIENKHA